jgi:hypothetical protein
MESKDDSAVPSINVEAKAKKAAAPMETRPERQSERQEARQPAQLLADARGQEQ